MSKYTGRILDEVEENFSNHFTSYDERVEFLEELIDDLTTMMDRLPEDEDEDEDEDEEDSDLSPLDIKHFTSYDERVEFLEDLIDDITTMMGTLSRIALSMAIKAAKDEDVK